MLRRKRGALCPGCDVSSPVQVVEQPAKIAVAGAQEAAEHQHGLRPGGALDQRIRGSSSAVAGERQYCHARRQGVVHLRLREVRRDIIPGGHVWARA